MLIETHVHAYTHPYAYTLSHSSHAPVMARSRGGLTWQTRRRCSPSTNTTASCIAQCRNWKQWEGEQKEEKRKERRRGRKMRVRNKEEERNKVSSTRNAQQVSWVYGEGPQRKNHSQPEAAQDECARVQRVGQLEPTWSPGKRQSIVMTRLTSRKKDTHTYTHSHTHTHTHTHTQSLTHTTSSRGKRQAMNLRSTWPRTCNAAMVSFVKRMLAISWQSGEKLL